MTPCEAVTKFGPGRVSRGTLAKCPDAARSRGFGDTLARFIGRFWKKPCGGCKKRQATLNRLVPYRPAS